MRKYEETDKKYNENFQDKSFLFVEYFDSHWKRKKREKMDEDER